MAHATNVCQRGMLILACSFLADEQQHAVALNGKEMKSVQINTGLMKAHSCLMERAEHALPNALIQPKGSVGCRG